MFFMTILEIILSFVLFASFIGIGTIFFRKIPLLVKLPEVESVRESLVSKVRKGVAKLPGAKKFDYELYLQKMLSKVRVLTLKTENKTGNWLERLRQRRNGHNNEYWEELKKAKDGK